jgi:hypothetical protein
MYHSDTVRNPWMDYKEKIKGNTIPNEKISTLCVGIENNIFFYFLSDASLLWLIAPRRRHVLTSHWVIYARALSPVTNVVTLWKQLVLYLICNLIAGHHRKSCSSLKVSSSRQCRAPQSLKQILCECHVTDRALGWAQYGPSIRRWKTMYVTNLCELITCRVLKMTTAYKRNTDRIFNPLKPKLV